jgi:hypothetical protein
MNKYTVKFLSHFFSIFQCHIIEIFLKEKVAKGIVSYDDNSGKQQFIWTVINTSNWDDGIELIDTLIENNLIDNDRIIVSIEELFTRLNNAGWRKERLTKAIDMLLSIEVKMVDDNKPTDSFFIHF